MYKRLVIAAACVALAACSSPPKDTPAAAAAPPAAAAQPATPAKSSRPRIVVLGDSLTAGLGLRVEQSYPSLLQQLVNSEGLKYEVVNAGVSGDTSAGGLARLDWALDGDVRFLIV